MKNVAKKFYPKCPQGIDALRSRVSRSLIATLSVSVMLLPTMVSNAGEKEVWYDANGKPVLLKDKTTGHMRGLTEKELAALAEKERQATHANSEDESTSETVEEPIDLEAKLRESIARSTPSPLIVDKNSVIPSGLTPKIYSDEGYSFPRAHYYSPYYRSSYPYLFQRYVPRFSRNGYYGKSSPYRNHGFHYYHRGSNGGYYLRYSRPGLRIRARF